MSAPLTPEQIEKTMTQVSHFLSQYFEGWSMVGFHAATGQPFSFRFALDAKTAFALNALLANAACATVAPIQDPPEDGKISD